MTTVEGTRRRGAVAQIGSGVFTAAKGTLQLALFLATYGGGLLSRTAVRLAQRRRRAAAPAATTPPATLAEVTPIDFTPIDFTPIEFAPAVSRSRELRGVVLRIGLVALVVGGIAAAASAVIRMRGHQVPEPAAAPPSVRADTNGSGEIITYVELSD